MTGTTTANIEYRPVKLSKKIHKRKKDKMKKVNITETVIEVLKENQDELLSIAVLALKDNLSEESLQEHFKESVDEVKANYGDDVEVVVEWNQVLKAADVSNNEYSKTFNSISEVLSKVEGVEETTVSEAVGLIANSVSLFSAKLTEQFDQSVDEAVEAKVEELEESINERYESSVTKWIEKKSEVIAESKLDAAGKSLIAGLKNLVAEHKLNTDEESATQLEELQNENESLKQKFAEAQDLFEQLKSQSRKDEKKAVFDQVSEGLNDTKTQKLKMLAKNATFVSADEYKSELESLVEAFLKEPAKVEEEPSPITEGKETKEEPTPLSESAPIMSYGKMISKIS